MQAMYTLEACEELMEYYAELGGDVVTVQEGSLGLGVVVCMAEGRKTAIIKEVYLNPWSSGHTIRLYNKTPKKYLEMVEAI